MTAFETHNRLGNSQ